MIEVWKVDLHGNEWRQAARDNAVERQATGAPGQIRQSSIQAAAP